MSNQDTSSTALNFWEGMFGNSMNVSAPNGTYVTYKDFVKRFDEVIEQESLKAREIFIPAKGYEGLYEVSNTGKVRSVKGGKRSGNELKQAGVGNGKRYMRVSFIKDGVSNNVFVHRIVSQSFLSNPDNKPHVNHIDGNPSNNDVSNLEWVTPSENETHSFRILGKLNGQRKLTDLQAMDIKKLLLEGASQLALAKRFNVSVVTINSIKRGIHYSLVGEPNDPNIILNQLEKGGEK